MYYLKDGMHEQLFPKEKVVQLQGQAAFQISILTTGWDGRTSDLSSGIAAINAQLETHKW